MKGTDRSMNKNPETIELLNAAEKAYNTAQSKWAQLKSQLTMTEQNERKLTTELWKGNSMCSTLQEKLTDQQMICENTLKKIQTRRQQTQDHLVEHSLLRMRLHQMQSMFGKEMEKFYDLEQHKFHLQLAIDERMVDLRCQTDLLTMKRKHLGEERSRLRADIIERMSKIDALRARYELDNELLGKNEDGTIISAVQLKIEAAQEREILLQQGSDLNEKVINAEHDIKALENTLILLNYSNDKYKRKMGMEFAQDDGNAN